MPILKNTLVWLDIPVTNLSRAIYFYQQLLNSSLLDHRPSSPTASLQLDGASNGLTLFKSDQETPVSTGMVPYINCDGRLEKAISQTQLNGGRVLQQIQSMEPFGYRAVILDSEGNRLALHANTINRDKIS